MGGTLDWVSLACKDPSFVLGSPSFYEDVVNKEPGSLNLVWKGPKVSPRIPSLASPSCPT